MPVNITVTDEAHKAVKMAAAASSEKIGDMASRILSKGCAKLQAKAAKKAAKAAK